MSTPEAYRAQVTLLLCVLPLVDEEPVFALKGGTAINLAPTMLVTRRWRCLLLAYKRKRHRVG